MKPEIKELWVNALESGEYIQGKGRLCLNGKYCCLGVLCDLAVKKGVIPRAVETRVAEGVAKEYGVGGETSFLPDEVRTWSGIGFADPYLPVPRRHSVSVSAKTLSNMNDDGISFTEIATKIKENL